EILYFIANHITHPVDLLHFRLNSTLSKVATDTTIIARCFLNAFDHLALVRLLAEYFQYPLVHGRYRDNKERVVSILINLYGPKIVETYDEHKLMSWKDAEPRLSPWWLEAYHALILATWRNEPSIVKMIVLSIDQTSGSSDDINELLAASESIDFALIAAVQRGQLELVRFLLEHQADIHLMDDYPLRESITKGRLTVADLLIDHGANIRANGDEAFRLAVVKGFHDLVKRLLTLGADIHAHNDEALISAVGNGDVELVKILVANGADLQANAELVLAEAIRFESEHAGEENHNKNLVGQMVEMGVNVHAGSEMALRWAVDDDNIELARLLLDYGADMHAECGPAFDRAISSSKEDLVRLFLDHGANVHARCDDFIFSLVPDCHPINHTILKMLVERGANPHFDEDALLRTAVLSDLNLKMVQYLIGLGADVHVKHDQALRRAPSQSGGMSSSLLATTKPTRPMSADTANTPSPQQHPRLSTLPIEILCSIASHISHPIDLLHFRLNTALLTVSTDPNIISHCFLNGFNQRALLRLLSDYYDFPLIHGRNRTNFPLVASLLIRLYGSGIIEPRDDRRWVCVKGPEPELSPWWLNTYDSLLLALWRDEPQISNEIALAHFDSDAVGETRTKDSEEFDSFEFALILGVERNYIELVSILINHYRDDDLFKTLLKYAIENCRVEMAELLIERGAKIRANDDEALRLAARHTCFPLVQKLVSHGADIHANNDEALMSAVRNGDMELLLFLIEHGADLQANSDRVWAHAIRFDGEHAHVGKDKNIHLVQWMLDRGVNVHAGNELALKQAVDVNNLDLVRLLLDYGADIHADYSRALDRAIFNSNPDLVQLLLDRGANIHARNDDFIFSALKYHFLPINQPILQKLVEKGANVHYDDEAVLRTAVLREWNLKTVKYVLELGADVHVKDEQPLRRAVRKGNEEIVRLLLEYGADPKVRRWQAYWSAAFRGRFKVLKMLLDHKGIYKAAAHPKR
ncbi:hypothetical protein HK102_000272, partial [Quaeritorhiza haematococci]